MPTPPRWPAVSGGPIPARWWIVALLLAGAVLHGWLLARQGALAGRVGEAVARRLRNALWDHLQHLPVDYIRQRGPGRLLLRFISDTRSVQRLVTEGIIKLTQELLLGVGVLAALAWLNWRMATAVLVILPIYFLILRRVNPSLRKESRATRRRRSRLSAHLNERIGGIVAVKAAARHRAESRRVRRLNRAVARRGTRLASVGARLAGMAATVLGVTGAIVLALAGREVDAGRLTGGALVAFYALLALLLPVFRRLIVANRYFQEARISVDRLRETLAEPRESEGLDLPRLNITEGLLRLEGISFAYNGGPPVLRDVNLEARRGRLVAIVGSNGAGKSTLLDLILRFRRPSTGRITIDGHDIEAVSLASLRSRIGLVTQDAPVFDGTLAENVDYGHRERDGDPAPSRRRAAALAGLDRVVDASPLGWESPVGPGGRYLSAGQRQRLALARALASDPPLLVLDEATSALDAETEETLAITLKELARHKTVIVAAHRPATLRLADDIYVLGDGRIVEHGCHQALIAANGSYARLFAPQPGP